MFGAGSVAFNLKTFLQMRLFSMQTIITVLVGVVIGVLYGDKIKAKVPGLGKGNTSQTGDAPTE